VAKEQPTYATLNAAASSNLFNGSPLSGQFLGGSTSGNTWLTTTNEAKSSYLSAENILNM
jgi:hypothetical protein